MREGRWRLSPALAVLAAAGLSLAAVPIPSKPEKYLADRAGVFDDARGRALNEKLAGFERATSNQIVVDVERKLPEGTTLEELANRAFHEWKIGQKGNSNGVLFLVFLDDRRMRIEVGYGLEGAIPDLRSHQILDEVVKPWFKKGDYAGGIEAGVDAILSAARNEPYRGTGRTAAEASRASRGLSSFLGSSCVVLGVLFLGLALLAIFLFRGLKKLGDRVGRSRPQPTHSDAASWSSSPDSSSSTSSSSSDSSSSSSSDFSGGGGDSGGGGSSDSW